MKKTILFYLLFFFWFNYAYAQYNSSSQPSNLGLSFNLLGPIFGEYNLGVSTFLNPYLQVGVDSTYYATQYISPEIDGWQSELRVNYFFSTYKRSSFYIGATGGFESVKVKQDSNSSWKSYNDLTWSIIPGYAWAAGRGFTIMLGLSYGYSLGDNQIGPEISFVLFM